MSNDFMQVLLGLAVVIVGAAGAYAISTIASFYRSKRDQIMSEIETSETFKYNQMARDAVITIDRIVTNVVNQLDDTMKKEILAASADGKLTEEEKDRLKNLAVCIINEQVSDSVKEFASLLIGDLDIYITTTIENKVTKLKEEKLDRV